MAKVKAAGILIVRQMLKMRGCKIEKELLDILTTEEARFYHTALACTWVPIPIAQHIYELAVKILFPEDPQGLRYIGRAMAVDNINGIYRFLVRFTTVAFMVQQASRLWETYHDEGKAHAYQESKKNVVHFVVKHYPKLPAPIRELLCGYIEGLAELTGRRNIKVVRLSHDPDAWEWELTWE